MDKATLFYLITAATLVLPLVFILLILLYRTSIPFSRNTDTSRSEQFLAMLDLDINTYLAIYAYMSFLFQLTSMTLLGIIELNNTPSVFTPNTISAFPPEVPLTLFACSVIAGITQLILMFLVVLGFLYDLPNHVNPTLPQVTEITSWAQQTQDFASIRLTRFENSEKTIIYANCRNDRSGTFFKLALCQAKEEGARTNCYVYDEEAQTLHKIIPPPITVVELEKAFSLNHN